jgi:hypothetical protein
MGALPGHYDPWLGQQRLRDPEPLALDAQIDQMALEGPFDADDGNTLLTFARRAAVFSIREGTPAKLNAGLRACAALDTAVVDERDILWDIALLHHAATRIGLSPTTALRAAGTPANPTFTRLIEGFLARSPVEKDLRDAWGYVEVQAPGGVGLLPWGFRPWMPTLDLATAAVAIADVVSADSYQADDPTLATELPEVWLSGAADPALGYILGSARGTVTINSRLRPEATEDHASQQLTIWLVEASDTNSAERLVAMSQHERPGTVMIGTSEGAVFALAIARSFVHEVATYETPTSLARFKVSLQEAIDAVAY